MANFSVTNTTAIGGGNVQQALTATYKTMVLLANSTATTAANGAGLLRRGKLYDILIGTFGTPADNALEFDVTRATVGTTPSGITTTLVTSLSSNFGLDPADNGNCVNAIQINSTAEVGIAATTEVWYIGINQRASYRWVAAPGSELVWPAVSSATASGGLAVRARSNAFVGNVSVTTLFQEQ